MSRRLNLSYVLPVRSPDTDGVGELAAYLRRIAQIASEVIVVDGSDEAVFAVHRREFGSTVRHMPPLQLGSAMGKVDGVITGMRSASHERVVIADDDVRYDTNGLKRVTALLDRAELVRPQNYFEPLTWHARIDTSRSLLNRVFSGDLDEPAADFPGTLAVRRSFFEAMGEYDGDAMFENLELIRTVRAAGGRVCSPLDLYVARLPPSTRHFLSQRVRQAYDDFALPVRLAAALALLPAVVYAILRGRPRLLIGGGATLMAFAEVGRRRAGGAAFFPASASLLAPVWTLERAITAWLAVRARLRHGGVHYAGHMVRIAANPPRRLRRLQRSR